MVIKERSRLQWFMAGCLAAAACLWLASPTDAQPTAGRPKKSAAPDAPAAPRDVPEPLAMKAAVERVDGLAGSLRYDGKKVIGVQADKNPASDEDVKVFAGLTDLEEIELRGEAITDAAVG